MIRTSVPLDLFWRVLSECRDAQWFCLDLSTRVVSEVRGAVGVERGRESLFVDIVNNRQGCSEFPVILWNSRCGIDSGAVGRPLLPYTQVD